MVIQTMVINIITYNYYGYINWLMVSTHLKKKILVSWDSYSQYMEK